MTTRRSFMKKAGAGLLVAGASSFFPGQVVAKSFTESGTKDAAETDLFKIGMAGFSFVKFNLDQTLEMMKKIDVHYLCIKDFHLPLTCTEEEAKAFHAKLAESNVTGYAVGPIYMKTEAEIDKGFEYCKRVGVKLIVGVPNVELLPYVDKKVKEYGFNYAIHLHGPDIKLYPNAVDVYEHVKNLDARIGMCLDIGHDLRDKQDPVADLKKYASRVFDIHIKDVTEASKAGVAIEMGRGKVDIPAFVKMLRKVKYNGVCSLEYEKDMTDPLVGMAQSIGYFKGVVAGTK